MLRAYLAAAAAALAFGAAWISPWAPAWAPPWAPGAGGCLAQELKAETKAAESADAPPVYVPPRRGGPANVAAAATRSGSDATPRLKLLAPAHTGLTVAAQPTLYLYVAEPGTVRVRVMRAASLADAPLATGQIDVAAAPAIVPLSLLGLNATLRPGTAYEVIVSMYDGRSGAMRGGDSAMIERVSEPAGLSAAQTGAPLARARLFAKAGLWFDAVGAVSEAVNAAPASPAARGHRAALLEQAGLGAIAEFDRKGPRG